MCYGGSRIIYMGRHNTVAGRMAESAAFRGKLFTKLARAITVAARSGSDPNMNAALRTAIAKAKDNSMPKDNIERAIKKGSGEGKDAAQFEEMLYEGFGPGGAGILVEVLTDNRNRTYPELRVLFQKGGGNLGEVGSISWMFQKKGVFVIDAQQVQEERVLNVALEHGAEDVEHDENLLIVTCQPIEFANLREALLAENIPFQKAGIEFIPDNEIILNGEQAQKMQELIDSLHNQDDVQNIYSNAVFS